MAAIATDPYTYEQWVDSAEFVTLTDGKLAYVHKGTGFPVVMLHFNGGESWWWSRVIDEIGRHFSAYALDLPGCGQSDVPLLPYTVPDMGDCIIEFMNAVGIDKAHFIGVHGGGPYSVQVAVTRPTRVGRLVLDNYGNVNRTEAKTLFRDVIKATWMDENEFMLPISEWSGIGDDGFDYFPSLKGTAEHERCMQRVSDGWMRNRKWTASLAKMGAIFDEFDSLPRVQSAALCMYGDGDWQSAPMGDGEPPISRLLHGLTGARTACISNAGLVPAYEQPAEWLKIVLDFLLKVG
jgi:pimeloyl-ACP methyl ester carboxylesterase